MAAQETAPKPAQVDALVREYAAAQAVVATHKNDMKLAEKTSDELKAKLVELVNRHGFRHTEKSMRLEGLHSKATVTTGTRFVTDAEAVEGLRTYLDKQELTEISGKLFRQHVSYSLVASPQEVLASVDLPTKILNKLKSLVGICFKMETNAPALKVEIAEAK